MQRDINKRKMLEDIRVRMHLVNLYGKSGQLDQCWEIFGGVNSSKSTETVIWNAMIHALGRNGQIEKAMELYQTMRENERVQVDAKTYILLLNALSHVGEVERADELWRNEIADDEMKYDRFVMTSLVDCFTRKGKMEEALERVLEYEDKRDAAGQFDHIMWMALLNGCSKHPGQSVESVIVREYAKRFDSVSTATQSLLSPLHSDSVTSRGDQMSELSSIVSQL